MKLTLGEWCEITSTAAHEMRDDIWREGDVITMRAFMAELRQSLRCSARDLASDRYEDEDEDDYS